MKFYVLQVVVLALAMLMVSGPVQAEWLDTFDGGFDQTWLPPGGGSITGAGGSSGSLTFTSVSNMLQVQDPTVVIAGGAAIGYGVVAETFSEFLVGAILNPAQEGDLHRDVGVLARITGATPLAMTGYALTVDFSNDSGVMSLSKINVLLDVDNLDSRTLSPFTSADSVYIQLRGVGDKLVGSAYDQIGGSLLDEIVWNDGDYAAGSAGVVVNITPDDPDAVPFPPEYNIPLRGTYDMVSAGIPEPSTVAMLISGCLCALGLAWRKRQRQS